MNNKQETMNRQQETISFDVVEETKAIASEIGESFYNYTERKVNPEDAQEKAFSEMDRAINSGESVDTIMEKIGCFQYEAEKDAFYAGVEAAIRIISERITDHH